MKNEPRLKYVTDNEIAFRDYEGASKVAEILLENDYACMLTMEDNLYILNYEYVEYANRNHMIFRSREDWAFEEEEYNEAMLELEQTAERLKDYEEGWTRYDD